MDFLKWLLFGIAVLWIIWFLTGGQYSGKTSNPFLEPPAPLGPSETYGTPFSNPPTNSSGNNTGSGGGAIDTKDSGITSLFKGTASLHSGNANATAVQEEYLELKASSNNAQPVNITGWKLKSAITGKEVTIGKGVYLPSSGIVNRDEQIFLNPGESAIIMSGRSPNGVSFRLNACIGYFEQFQDFVPSLPQSCPRINFNSLPSVGADALNDACLQYLNQIPSCYAHFQSVPAQLSSQCQEYITKNLHYNGCVEQYKKEPGFYGNEWRIFLGYDSELWKSNRETIKLLDQSGKIIGSLSY